MLDKPLFRNLLIIFIISGGYVFLWFSALTNSDYTYTVCMVKNVTGYACPGCGMGRASIELFKGDLRESLHYHWWAVPFHIMALTAFFWVLRDLFTGSDSFWKFITKPVKPWALAVILILVAANWCRALYLGI